MGIVPLLAYGYTLAAGYVIRPKLRIAAFIKVYLTIVKKTAKQDREGRIHYSEEELIRYMAVSPMMGRRLFPYAENGEHQILLGNRRENRGFSVEKLRSVITVNARFYVYPPKKKSDILYLVTDNPRTIVYNYFYTS